VTLRPIAGVLRELGQRELLLETGEKSVVRFRLLVRTQFRDKQGESIRDSLLKAGDRVVVQVSEEDEETALRVVLERAGTEAERAAAAKPVDRRTIRGPSAADARSEEAGDKEPVRAEKEKEEEAKPGPEVRPGDPRPPAQKAVDPVIADARLAARRLAQGLPDYVVDQVTRRERSFNNEASWQTVDEVTAEVVSVRGKEEYRNVKVGGVPNSHPEQSGVWTTGEFSTTLEDVLEPGNVEEFTRSGEDWVGGRRALLYEFQVPVQDSHWILAWPDGRQAKAGYQGRIWIDKETHRVLAIEQRAKGLPAGFPLDKAETSVEYGYLAIDGRDSLLPVKGRSLSCQRGTVQCYRNEVEFRNYRKFGAQSTIKF